jgi:Protein of unknown function (DUF3307)
VTDPVAAVVAVFAVLEIKHFIFDYVLQTPYQFRNKGIYGHPGGILHSGLQVFGTLFAFLIITPTLALGVAIVIGEFVLHYHIDWGKEQLLKRHAWTTETGPYWIAMGGDQLAHHLTYVAIAALLAGVI